MAMALTHFVKILTWPKARGVKILAGPKNKRLRKILTGPEFKILLKARAQESRKAVTKPAIFSTGGLKDQNTDGAQRAKY